MSKTSALDRIWARISKCGDFPILSRSLHATVAAMNDEDCDFSAMVQVVLSDFSLTQKVLRLANSAMYRVFGGNITTVSRALTVLGADAVVHLVIGFKILEHFRDSESSRTDVEVELHRAILSSCVARALTVQDDPLVAEEAVICALMRQTGRLLVAVYLDGEWNQIRLQAEANVDESEACRAVLGATFDDIGREAASRWRLPYVIQSGLEAFDPNATGEEDHAQRLRAITSYSTDVTDVLTRQSLSDAQRDVSISSLADRYGVALAMDPTVLAAKSISLACGGAGAAILREIAELRANVTASRGGMLVPQMRILAGTNDLRALSATPALELALAVACETVSEALGCARTVAFVMDDSGIFRARVGFGSNIDEALSGLSFGSAFEPDVFHLAIRNSVAILIDNARAPKMIARLPGWYRVTFGDTHSFVLLPVTGANQSTVALLYGDWSDAQQRRKFSCDEMVALNELARELGRSFLWQFPD
ncbi:HDOD domain-containing protein [Paraburkholderia mimosarum]|uniref:HDOD domain-containing protein n=1 Tax=Paraburkholderia mimosarum TaxID=312026 RepID=UPI00048959DE|nr:HDOD domain-containing protein [Paraburkholderia mimosarum]